MDRSHLPALKAAVQSCLETLAHAQPYHGEIIRSESAKANAAPVIEALGALRRALTPGNPDWTGAAYPDDLREPVRGLPRGLAVLLRRVWDRSYNDLRDPRPRFFGTGLGEWELLLGDVLRLVGEELTPAGVPDPGVSPNGVLVLKALFQHLPARQTLAKICGTLQDTLSEKTIGRELKKLIDAGLAIRPQGERLGATLTPAGISVVQNFPADPPASA
jgi:hypothetical protein